MISSKKRLLFVNGHLNVGGVEKSLVDLLRHLDFARYDVDLLLVQGLGDFRQDLPSEVNVIYKDTKPAYGPFLQILKSNLQARRFSPVFFRIVVLFSRLFGKKNIFLLRTVLGLSEHYDTAIAYRTGLCEDIVAYAVKSRKKLLWWHHGECNYTREQIIQANKTWLRFDYVVTVSEGCKKMLQSSFSYPVDRYVVIPNFIDIEHIHQMAGEISPYINDSSALKLVTVGRLSVEKHIDNAPVAARLLIDNGVKNFRWYIIGDGDERDKIEKIIEEQHVAPHVKMLGSKANPYPYIKFADILVHTSYVESQSITVLEAMALKTPCVVCKSIGPMDFMEQGVNGVLVEKGVEGLYEGIYDMVRIMHKGCTSMIRAAFHTVDKRYSSEVNVTHFNHIVN